MSSQVTSSSGASGSGGQPETTVVDEIPESLNKILLMIVKNFFSNEHFLVVYYIMRSQCIREENLKARLQFDQKLLRQLLAQLKQEKLVKERLFSQKNDNNRTVSIIFYFINYRAVLNVIRYKIDHMRLKLESREQQDTNRDHYKCTQCSSTYDMLEITRIHDYESGKLVCWRCHGEVIADESIVPSQSTRTAVARFNEQMTPLFSQMAALNGIQLAPHLLEPDISKYLEDDKARAELALQLDFTSGGGNRIQLGGVAHSYHNAATINYQHGDQVTVDLNADINNRPVEEAKQVPLWLQDNAIGGEEASHNEQILNAVIDDDDTAVSSTKSRRKGLSIEYLKSIEFGGQEENVPSSAQSQEPDVKKIKLEDGSNGNAEVKTEVDNDDPNANGVPMDEDDDFVYVGGRLLPLSQITPQMVQEEMNEQEQEQYIHVVQELFAY